MKLYTFSSAGTITVRDLDPGLYSIQAVVVVQATSEPDPDKYARVFPDDGIPLLGTELSSGMDGNVVNLLISQNTQVGSGSWLYNKHEPGPLSLTAEIDEASASVDVKVYLDIKKQ